MRGVHCHKGRWVAQAMVCGQVYRFGRFETEAEARVAYADGVASLPSTGGLKTPADIAAAAAEHGAGISLREIAAKRGVDENTLSRKLRAAGHSTPGPHGSRGRRGEGFCRRQSARLQGIPLREWREFRAKRRRTTGRSPDLRQWQRLVLARDSWTCRDCGAQRCELHAHHIYRRSEYPLLRLDVNNGITLCWKCHKSIRGREEELAASYRQKLGLLPLAAAACGLLIGGV